MVKYCINVSDDDNVKFISEFPEPESLFQKVVADAVQSYDSKAAAALIPPVVRIDESTVEVTTEIIP
jgi:hypothetical protein